MSIVDSGVMLRSYSGQLSQVKVQALLSVRFSDREYQEASLHAVKVVPSLLTEVQSLFQTGVATFPGTTARIYAPERARPRYFKTRPLPLALKDRVTQKLQKLQREGILVPIKTSVRIGGDFKGTINPVATIEKHPFSWIEDLWSVFSGGRKFTKLDLRDAYQQLALQDAARKYVTISKTLGLFQYTRLPFGIASAPALIQREMSNLFRGVRHVAVYFDGILVTFSEDGEHLQILCNVVALLQGAGLEFKREK
nr:uncharacterized protein K02A2.6-like [Dermacentor andersoni]